MFFFLWLISSVQLNNISYRLYFFGGFGPVPEFGARFQHLIDITTEPSGWPRGWNNQLVVYNPVSNSWEWPRARGPTPAPRAAHAADISGHKVGHMCVLWTLPQIYTCWPVLFVTGTGTDICQFARHDSPSTLLKCLHTWQSLQTAVFKTGLHCSVSLPSVIILYQMTMFTFPRIQVFGMWCSVIWWVVFNILNAWCVFFILSSKNRPAVLCRLHDLWRWKHFDPSKYWWPLTQWCIITSQNTRILISTTVRTSHLLLLGLH